MITFILSLSLVDYRHRQWRLSQHASSDQATFWSWFHRAPFQDADGTWKHNDKTVFQNPANAVLKKHRAVTKMEVNDAVDIRGRVLAAIVLWSAVLIFVLYFATKRLYGWIVFGP